MFFPSLRHLLHRLSQPTWPIRRPARRGAARGFRPRLEILEDRTVPSTVNWVGGSGDWSNANNWLDATTMTHHTPGATDDAVINQAGITVTHSTGTDTVRSLRSEDAFVLSGGTLNMSNASTIDNTFTMSSNPSPNTILSGTGDLTVNGLLIWMSGTMSGTGHTIAKGGLTISSSTDILNPTRLDGRALDNAGDAIWVGLGNIAIGNGARMNNLAGATFEDETDALVTGFGSTPGTFNNAGMFTKLNSSGTTNLGIAFNNSGTLDVQTGTFNLNVGADNTGAFIVESGAILGFGGGTATFRPTSSVSGSGTVNITGDFFSNGIVNVLGSYSVANTNLSGATLDFGTAATLTNLNLSGGTLTGLGTVLVTGTLNWADSVMTGTGITTVSGALNISGRSVVLNTRTLNNAGIAAWTTGRIEMINGGVFNNLPGATFNALTDTDIGSAFFSFGAFNNAGTFTKSESTGQTSIFIFFNNSGTVEVQTGTLQLSNDSTDSGTFTVDTGATLNFSDGIHTLTDTSVINGNGDVQFIGAGQNNILGTFMLGGTVTVNGGLNTRTVTFVSDVDLATLTFTGGTITGSGTVTVEDQLTWTGGTMSGPGRTVSNGTLNVSNSLSFGGPTLDRRTLDNAGTAIFTGTGILGVNNSSVINNLAGATFLAQGNGGISTTGGGVFNNAGDFQKNESSGTTGLSLTFNNSGSVEVETGTLILMGAGDSTGSMSVSAAATLEVAGSPYTFRDSSSVAGDGTVQFGTSGVLSGGTTNVEGSYAPANTVITNATANFAADNTITALTLSGGTLTGFGSLTVTGPLNWTGGTMSGVGTTTAAGTLNISSGNSKLLTGRTLDNQGTATWTGSGTISVSNGAVLDNQAGATFLIQSDTTLNGGNFGDTPGSLINEGTLQKQASSATTTISIPFSNTGTADAHTGTLSFMSTYTQTAGTTSLSGGSLRATSGVSLQGGVLSGSGTVNGDVTNSGGEVAPGGDGSAGILTINGTYTQTANGMLSIDLGGTAANQFDQLKVNGAATLDGLLQVQLINGFSPVAGNQFQVLTFGSRPGNTNFATDSFPDLGTGLSLAPVFNATNLTLATRGSAALDPAAAGSVDQVSNTVNSVPFISNNDNNDFSAILEYDLSNFRGSAVTGATIAGTIFANNFLDTGDRGIAIEVFAGHSGVSVGDASTPATLAGTVTYHPPTDAHVDFSFDITGLVQNLLNSGATFIGVRFRGVNSPQAPSVLDPMNLPTLTVTT